MKSRKDRRSPIRALSPPRPKPTCELSIIAEEPSRHLSSLDDEVRTGTFAQRVGAPLMGRVLPPLTVVTESGGEDKIRSPLALLAVEKGEAVLLARWPEPEIVDMREERWEKHVQSVEKYVHRPSINTEVGLLGSAWRSVLQQIIDDNA